MGYTYDFINSNAIIDYEFVVIASLLTLVSGGERSANIVIFLTAKTKKSVSGQHAGRFAQIRNGITYGT